MGRCAMEIELDVKLEPGEDGNATLTVSGPVDGVVLAYGLVMQGLSMFGPDAADDDRISDSSVG